MRFAWDDAKNRKNIIKHKISFEVALNVFKDKNRVELFDIFHSEIEDRYICIGIINGVAYLITVVYTERRDVIRIISARRATKRERKLYYDSLQRH